jgi:hypothetical protein
VCVQISLLLAADYLYTTINMLSGGKAYAFGCRRLKGWNFSCQVYGSSPELQTALSAKQYLLRGSATAPSRVGADLTYST